MELVFGQRFPPLFRASLRECSTHSRRTYVLLLSSDSEGRWFESSRAYFPQVLDFQGVAGFLLFWIYKEFGAFFTLQCILSGKMSETEEKSCPQIQ